MPPSGMPKCNGSLPNNSFLSSPYNRWHVLKVVRLQLFQRILLSGHISTPSIFTLLGASSSQDVHSSTSVYLGNDSLLCQICILISLEMRIPLLGKYKLMARVAIKNHPFSAHSPSHRKPACAAGFFQTPEPHVQSPPRSFKAEGVLHPSHHSHSTGAKATFSEIACTSFHLHFSDD